MNEEMKADYNHLVEHSRSVIRKMFEGAKGKVPTFSAKVSDKDIEEFATITVAAILEGMDKLDALSMAAASVNAMKLNNV